MGRPNPSYLKRQKEQARKERAEEKRAVRHGKKAKPVRAEGEGEGDGESQTEGEPETKEQN